MNDDANMVEEPREEIARLESRIEELTDDLERCRKLAVFSKILLAGGALWMTATIFGVANMGMAGAMGSISAILGGFILGGSNRSTMQQARSALETAEARRTNLIASMDLRTVSGHFETGSTRTVH